MEKPKNFIKEIKNREKNVDKKGFTKYLSYERATLVNNLSDQNTQDLGKVWIRLNRKRLN